MAHLSKIFTKTPVEVSNKSGFDLSHENLFTAKCGTITPVLCEELLPNDTVSLGEMIQVQLPPMATDFYGRVDVRLEAFFVPNRLLWGGWEDFITNPTQDPYNPNAGINRPLNLPKITVSAALANGSLGAGTLADYLGYKAVYTPSPSNSITVKNALPFLAYHKICDDWYRSSEVTVPYLNKASARSASKLPWTATSVVLDVSNPTSGTFDDGKLVTSLRQRCWAKDYFTTANLYPQAGGVSNSTVTFDVAGSGSGDGVGSFTIATLRAANALQRWMERNNIAGYRYSDQIKAQFGILPSDALMDRALFLGATCHNVYNKSVYMTSDSTEENATYSSRNPFATPATKYGDSNAFGQDTLVDKFTASEHGFLMVMFTLVPHAYYGLGRRRYIDRSTMGDFAFPTLQGTGQQAIKKSELNGAVGADGDATFGYTDQYAEYKYHDDEVHGLLRDGQNLSMFALQRSVTTPVLNTAFLEIPQDYLDQVTATNASVSQFGCWCDMYLSFKKVSTLAQYVIPTLGDIKNTHIEYVDKGGRRL